MPQVSERRRALRYALNLILRVKRQPYVVQGDGTGTLRKPSATMLNAAHFSGDVGHAAPWGQFPPLLTNQSWGSPTAEAVPLKCLLLQHRRPVGEAT
jgi:hypothetical protein